MVLLSSLSTILTSACQATGSNKNNQITFVDKKWKLHTFTVNPSVDWDLNGTQDTDIFALLDPCDRDDFLMFRRDGVIIRFVGTEKCDEEDEDQLEDGTWTTEQNNTIVFRWEDHEDKAEIPESTADKLVLVHRFKSTDGITHKLTAEYQLK